MICSLILIKSPVQFPDSGKQPASAVCPWASCFALAPSILTFLSCLSVSGLNAVFLLYSLRRSLTDATSEENLVGRLLMGAMQIVAVAVDDRCGQAGHALSAPS